MKDKAETSISLKDKVETLIGFAVKARKIVIGTDNILKSRAVRLIICCAELKQNSLDKLINTADGKIPVIISHNPLENIIYKQGVKAIAITDKQMSDAIIKNLTCRFTVVGEERSV